MLQHVTYWHFTVAEFNMPYSYSTHSFLHFISQHLAEDTGVRLGSMYIVKKKTVLFYFTTKDFTTGYCALITTKKTVVLPYVVSKFSTSICATNVLKFCQSSAHWHATTGPGT